MFFILSKILLFLLDPIIWIFILLLWGALSKNAIKKKKIIWTTVFIIYLFSNSFIVNEFISAYEEQTKSYADLTEKYDVAIVLGGFSNYDNTHNLVQFNSATDRLMAGIKLLKTGRVKKLMIVSGSGKILKPNEKEALFVKGYLLSIGIPSSDLIIESESKNTRENAVNSAKILNKKYTNGNFILVTSALHMPRAIRCFTKVDINIIPFSVDHQSKNREFVFDNLFLPNNDSFKKWKSLIKEWAGFLTYKLNNYI